MPQWSILGPLLYLVYVNDIDKSSYFYILSSADDTTLCLSHYNLNTLYINANKAIIDLCNWFCVNKLTLNAKETKCIAINPKIARYNMEEFN